MISFEKVSQYVKSLLDLKKVETDDLHEQLTKNKYPVVKKDISRFLEQIIMIKQPEKVLEIGTNEGYSATVIARNLTNGTIISIDYRDDHHAKARLNFEKFGVSDKIKLITERTQEVLPKLHESFDLIFIDAEKRSYPDYLDYAVSHLNPGGIIIVDNLFWKGSVISPESFDNKKAAVPTLQEFNIRFSILEGFNSQVLSIGDGLGFAVKENNGKN